MRKPRSLPSLICTVYLLNACGGSSAPRVVPPSIATTEAQLMAVPATVGTPYSFSFQALVSGQAPSPYIWQAVGLPASGLSLDPSSGTVSGTPTSKASVAFSLTLTDGAGRSSTAVQYTIAVNNPPPPVVTTTQAEVTAAPAMIENSYSFSFAASGGLTPLSWSETGNLPATLALSTSGVLSGTTATTGSYPITLVVQDALGQKTAPQNFTITVINPPPPTINTIPSPTIGVENHPYTFTFTATAGYPPLDWTESGALPAGLAFSGAGVISGTPTVAGSFPIAVTAQDSHGETAGPQNFTIQISLGFSSTGSMQSPRANHTATLLKTGKVLVAGGGTTSIATAELYDAVSGTFSPTGSMNTGRTEQVAILLLDGRVLVVGGVDANGNALAAAEIYDPATGKFSSTGDMKDPRVKHSATLLDDGRVLVAGGQAANGNILATAELFDPNTGTFSLTGVMMSPRASHTATLLNTGKVLVAGGYSFTGELASAEIFDSSSQSFTLTTNNMTVARADYTATLLKDGTVLLAGPDLTAELFDPSTGKFVATGKLPATTGGVGTTATLRIDGTVLVAGGEYITGCQFVPDVRHTLSAAAAELFDPGTGSFSQTGSLSMGRFRHTATLLANGRVLVTGGFANTLSGFPRGCPEEVDSVTPSAELFP